MFHVGRSGSTVLAKMLGQHPHVHWGEELFANIKSNVPSFQPTPRWVSAVIEAGVHKRRCAYFGFETKASHLWANCLNMSAEDYVFLLREMGFSRFIVLTRSNLLRVVISFSVGWQSREWHAASRSPRPSRVTVQVRALGPWHASLIEILDHYQNYYAQFDNLLAYAARLDLNYEADIESDPAVGYRKVCRFLEIEPERLEIPFGRTNPFSIEEMILNYDEVSDALRGTRFEWMLRA
jgi:LPS sulfotransferase NodH